MRTLLTTLALACLPWVTPAPCAAAPERAGSAPPPAPPPAPAQVLAGPIYRCTEGGLPVLADRPCAAGLSDARYFALRTPPAPGEQPSTAPSRAPPARPHTAPAGGPERARAAAVNRADATDGGCQRLRQRLDALDERMRRGYPARDAGRLLDQRRGLKQGLRAADC
jgi:hypothetical protein